MGCDKSGEERNRQGYKNIIDCIKLSSGHKHQHGETKKSPEKYSWGAPTDSETNKLMEEIDERLREEEEVEG
jgi:hypothetical protein